MMQKHAVFFYYRVSLPTLSQWRSHGWARVGGHVPTLSPPLPPPSWVLGFAEIRGVLGVGWEWVATNLCCLINIECFILLGECVCQLQIVSIFLAWLLEATGALPQHSAGNEVSQTFCAHPTSKLWLCYNVT